MHVDQSRGKNSSSTKGSNSAAFTETPDNLAKEITKNHQQKEQKMKNENLLQSHTQSKLIINHYSSSNLIK
jgi:hypothetical protein